jgi:hypothetical protein
VATEVSQVKLSEGCSIAGQAWKVPGVMDWKTMIYDPNHPATLQTTTLFASDRDLFIFLVDDLNPIQIGTVKNKVSGLDKPDILFRGFYITNSEVESRASRSRLSTCAPSAATECCNRIMWGVEGFEELTIRHSKLAHDRWMHEAQPALESYSDASAPQSVALGRCKSSSGRLAPETARPLWP